MCVLQEKTQLGEGLCYRNWVGHAPDHIQCLIYGLNKQDEAFSLVSFIQ